MIKKKNTNIDYPLFFAVVFLILFWMMMISSVSIFKSHEITLKLVNKGLIQEPYNYFYVIKNIFHVIAGFIVLILTVKIPYKFFEKYSPYLLLFTTFLLSYVLVFAKVVKWAKLWIDIPGLPFNIQPTELLKFTLILFLAYFFKRNIKKIKSFKYWFLPFLWIIVFFLIILALLPDFWTVMVLVPVAFIMFFLSWANVRYLTILTLIWIILSFWIYSSWKYNRNLWEERPKLAYITERIDYFLEDSKHLFDRKQINRGKTYQTKQALITIWSWGFSGLWLWNSIQKRWYLPEVQWDFIFSVIVEELGFLWSFILLSLYLFIAYRWFYIYSQVNDIFAKLVAAWISTWFITQAFINIWVNLNIMPLTWITLPFVSYWGSSLLTLMIALWVLLNISRELHGKTQFTRTKRRKMI